MPLPPPPLDCAVHDKLPDASVFKTSPLPPSVVGHLKPCKTTLPPFGVIFISPFTSVVTISFPFTSKFALNWGPESS